VDERYLELGSFNKNVVGFSDETHAKRLIMGLSAEERNKLHLIRALDLVQSCPCVQFVLVMTERVTLARAFFGTHKKSTRIVRSKFADWPGTTRAMGIDELIIRNRRGSIPPCGWGCFFASERGPYNGK
jgi:hypothetical protein